MFLLLCVTCSAVSKPIVIGSYLIPGLIESTSTGRLIELLKDIEQITHLEFEVKLYPTKRVQLMFQQGQLSAYFPELEAQRSFPSCRTAAFMEKKIVVFNRLSEPMITDIKQLKGKRVGAVRGFSYGKNITHNPDLTIEWVSNDEVNLKKLQARRIDAFVGDLSSSINAIKMLQLDNEVHYNLAQPINELDVFFMFQQDSQLGAVCNQVNEAILRLKQQGKLDDLFLK